MKDIAKITPPDKWTFAGVPNFVTIESKPHSTTLLDANIEVNVMQGQVNISDIAITNYAGNKTTLIGTTDKSEAGGNKFFVSTDKNITAENIRRCLSSIKWINNNYDIIILWNSTPNVINIKSKGGGAFYNVDIAVNASAYKLTWVNKTSKNNDSITGENQTTEIEIEICNTPTSAPFVSVQKTYAGMPVWFNLNNVFTHIFEHAKPTNNGWTETQRGASFYFRAYKRDEENILFYASDKINAIAGISLIYPLTDFVYKATIQNKIRQLSNKPSGNASLCEYVNFVMDADFKEANHTVAVRCKVSTQSKVAIATDTLHQVQINTIGVVNTCKIEIQPIVAKYPNAGIIELSIISVKDGKTVEIASAEPLFILPSNLHSDNYFTFRNALGGWDSWNIDAEEKKNTKVSVSSYQPCQTPDNPKLAEKVQQSELTEQWTMETIPLDTATRTWLVELSESPMIYDQDGRTIIIDEMNISITSTPEPVTIKYRKV